MIEAGHPHLVCMKEAGNSHLGMHARGRSSSLVCMIEAGHPHMVCMIEAGHPHLVCMMEAGNYHLSMHDRGRSSSLGMHGRALVKFITCKE